MGVIFDTRVHAPCARPVNTGIIWTSVFTAVDTTCEHDPRVVCTEL